MLFRRHPSISVVLLLTRYSSISAVSVSAIPYGEWDTATDILERNLSGWFSQKLTIMSAFKECFGYKLMTHSWFTTFQMCWRMPSTEIGTEIKVRKCLETLLQSLKDIAVYHKIHLLNIKSLDKLDIQLQTHSSQLILLTACQFDNSHCASSHLFQQNSGTSQFRRD